MKYSYNIYNPSGNITALVDSSVPYNSRKELATKLMKKEPTCEQVGFIARADNSGIALEMAGGEFCGNASLCAAYYYILNINNKAKNVKVKCSGCDEILTAEFGEKNNNSIVGTLEMPVPKEISEFKSHLLVKMQGISHIIVTNEKNCDDYIKEWADELDADALGIMYYNQSNETLDPLVYVRTVDTLFRENACVSGTCAVTAAMYYLNKNNNNLCLRQPGGVLSSVAADEYIKITNSIIWEKKDYIDF